MSPYIEATVIHYLHSPLLELLPFASGTAMNHLQLAEPMLRRRSALVAGVVAAHSPSWQYL